MTLKRFIRDFTVLLGFCGAFYLLTVLMSRLDKEPADSTDFSQARKRADVSMRTRDWTSASADFLALAKQDPYNGHAWYRCASSFNAQRNLVYQSIQTALADLNEAQESDTSEEESEETLKELQADLDRLGAQAKEAFSKAKQFARYRADSLLNLAAIESYEGNNAASLGYLEQFVNNGNYTARGLARYRVFGVSSGSIFETPEVDEPKIQVRLHSEAKFWEIVGKERKNQSR